MPKLVIFNQVTLDGYFVGAGGDIAWAHQEDPEFNAFVEDNAKGGGRLLFGRITYELMASYWPTPAGAPERSVCGRTHEQPAEGRIFQNTGQGVVSNTKLVKDGVSAEVRKMKKGARARMVIMGSGTIVQQLAQEGLIDEYQIVLAPVVLGKGRTMFDGIKEKARPEADEDAYLR